MSVSILYAFVGVGIGIGIDSFYCCQMWQLGALLKFEV
jgi:hypothetical protein